MKLRSRRVCAASAAMLLGAVLVTAPSRPTQGGLLDHRIKHYYEDRVVDQRPLKDKPSRRTFMRPYSADLLLDLTERRVLDRYKGRALDGDPILDRYEVAYFLGRAIRLVNARDGRVFAMDGSRDHQHFFLPQRGWGLFEAEAALAHRLLIPDWQVGWWEGHVTRYHLAAMIGKILKCLQPKTELIQFFTVSPAEDFTDFVHYGHPTWFRCQPALIHGVMGGASGRFRGLDHVRGHEMGEVVDRILGIASGYARNPAPMPSTNPDGSGLALPRPDIFPQALRTNRHADEPDQSP